MIKIGHGRAYRTIKNHNNAADMVTLPVQATNQLVTTLDTMFYANTSPASSNFEQDLYWQQLQARKYCQYHLV